jgi:cytochrome b subunit of formate dehydrogenase
VAASQTVHFYEAWLAMLAVIVWHLFFVIFHPDEYPMNWTWLTGKMDSSTARKHHPRWHAKIGDDSASPTLPDSGRLRLKSLLAFPRSVARRMIRGRSNPG